MDRRAWDGAGQARLGAAELRIFKCDCGYGTLIERPYCPRCHDPLLPGTTAPQGIVLTWTVIHISPDNNIVPIGLAMVGLGSGINAMARFEAERIPRIGEKVVVAIREDGLRWLDFLETEVIGAR